MRKIFFTIIATLASSLALPAKHSNLKISGGKSAEPGQFPFAVAINVIGDDYIKLAVCAGSIIHENWILTTAICSEWSGQSQIVVVSGTNQPDDDTGVTYNVSQIVVHPNYTQENFPDANVALFRIDGSFAFSDLVQSISLGEVSLNDSVVVAGWGDSTYPVLKYAELTVRPIEECEIEAEDNNIGSEDEVCASGGEGVGLCVGDIAAPLVFNGTLVGLASWGFWCGEFPDVYTRVSYYKEWINGVIKV